MWLRSFALAACWQAAMVSATALTLMHGFPSDEPISFQLSFANGTALLSEPLTYKQVYYVTAVGPSVEVSISVLFANNTLAASTERVTLAPGPSNVAVATPLYNNPIWYSGCKGNAAVCNQNNYFANRRRRDTSWNQRRRRRSGTFTAPVAWGIRFVKASPQPGQVSLFQIQSSAYHKIGWFQRVVPVGSSLKVFDATAATHLGDTSVTQHLTQQLPLKQFTGQELHLKAVRWMPDLQAIDDKEADAEDSQVSSSRTVYYSSTRAHRVFF